MVESSADDKAEIETYEYEPIAFRLFAIRLDNNVTLLRRSRQMAASTVYANILLDQQIGLQHSHPAENAQTCVHQEKPAADTCLLRNPLLTFPWMARFSSKENQSSSTTALVPVNLE